MKIVASMYLNSDKNIDLLLPYVDYLHLYVSDNVNTQKYINNKIIIARSKDYGNYGELGKYFWCDKIYDCYHLIICSDDLSENNLLCLSEDLSENNKVIINKDNILYYTSKLKINIYDIIIGKTVEQLCQEQNIIYELN
jgi:hypothetical protein